MDGERENMAPKSAGSLSRMLLLMGMSPSYSRVSIEGLMLMTTKQH
jgi:hypothetical protein